MTAKYAHLLPHATTALERSALAALQEHGTQAAAAAALGWSRERLQSRLRAVQARAHEAEESRQLDEAIDADLRAHGIDPATGVPAPDSEPVIRGSVHVAPNNPAPAPAPGARPCAASSRPVAAVHEL